jgi:hypothetical protein
MQLFNWFHFRHSFELKYDALDLQTFINHNTGNFIHNFLILNIVLILSLFQSATSFICRFHWPRDLRRRSAAVHLLRLWVRIPPGHGRLLWVLCVVRLRSLRRADQSSRGVLPTVMRRCVWSRNFVNEEALAHCGLSRQKQTNKFHFL